MECRRAEELVDRYISHSLSFQEMEEFLNHVEKCPSCYDELETYFIVHEAMAQLDDDDSDTILDMRKMLRQDITNSRNYLHKYNVIKGVVITAGVLAVMFLIVLFVYMILGVFALR